MKNSIISTNYNNAKGRYMGNIQHKSKGNFKFHEQIKSPDILAKGINYVDLFTHHPMVDNYLKVPNCCILEYKRFRKRFGSTMN